MRDSIIAAVASEKGTAGSIDEMMQQLSLIHIFCRGRFALLVGVDDGLGDRVGGSAFTGGSQPQKLILIERNALRCV